MDYIMDSFKESVYEEVPIETGRNAVKTISNRVSERYREKAGSRESDFRLEFTDESLLKGVILAEVLGKPKYFRRGRRF